MEACPTGMPRYGKDDIALLPTVEVTAMANTAKALSDPIRLQIIYLLTQQLELCTCEFEVLLDLPQSKVSYHLKVLFDAGLVGRETHGTWSHYRLLQSGALDSVRQLTAAGATEPALL